MSDIAISIEDLSKRYVIGHQRAKTDGLRHVVEEAARAPIAWLRSRREQKKQEKEEFWALTDISCEIKRGEVVGFIGKNGAGKSTLLKILSRITEPTKGRIRMIGRVASLLEVGTGFHPELTGRENIYLNGAILGMTRLEIKRKFDEIVAFSEVEKFLDTPVKRYSSGMYVRLAFAVAAHLEPEIMIVDEVLAVGDATFQRKCLGKMKDVAEGGRTVLFVSHNMAAITRLCDRAILLESGRIVKDGPAAEVAEKYLSADSGTEGTWTNAKGGESSSEGRITSVRVLPSDDGESEIATFDESVKVEIRYELGADLRDLSVICRVTDASGVVVLTSWDSDANAMQGPPREAGHYCSVCILPSKFLRPGNYWIGAGVAVPGVALDFHEHTASFEVSTVRYPLNLNRGGVVTPLLEWEFKGATLKVPQGMMVEK